MKGINPLTPVFYTDLFLRIVIAFALAWLTERHLQKWINSTTNLWLVLVAMNQVAGSEHASQ